MVRIKHRFLTLVLLAALTALFAGCSEPGAAVSANGSASAAGSKGSLLFFLDPNGRPCQMQEDVLVRVRSEIEQHAAIRYVQTNRKSDREIFYQYGIRALPSIILVGAGGAEVHRFTPGVQGPDQILAAVRKM